MFMKSKATSGALTLIRPLDADFSRTRTEAGARPRPALFSEEERRDYLTRFGWRSNAYFNLQDGVDYFDVPGVGFVSYYRQRRFRSEVPIVFTRPVCAALDLERLLSLFLAYQGARAVFVGIDAEVAAILRPLGFTTNVVATEFDLPLESFDLKGREMKYLRHAQNSGGKAVEVRELPWSKVDGQAVVDISTAWRLGKAVPDRELRLTTRPPEFKDRWGIRRFYAFKDGELVGYVFFDPFFRDGRVIGYTANILRSKPGLKPHGVLDYIILKAIEKFRAEGLETFSLGQAPLHGVVPCQGESSFLRRCAAFIYERCGSLFACKDLGFHKMRYRAKEEPMYLAKRGLGDLATVWLLLRATNAV